MTENQTDNIANNSETNIDKESPDLNEDLAIEDNTNNNQDLNNEILSDEIKNTISNTDARLEQLEKEHETLKSQYVRIAADFDNFRKRQSRDLDDLKVQLICKSLSAILPIVDNFERARQQLKPESEEAQTLHRSYQGLYKQLVDILKQQGVAPMRVVGQKFDPNLHEAVLREPSNEYEEDINIEELQRGYHIDGKVLRHALVKVSMGPGPKDVSQNEEEKDKVVDKEDPDKDLSES